MGNLGEELGIPDYYDRLEDMIGNIRELLGAIFIQEQRNYDMLVMIADKLGGDTDKMLNMHAQGSVLAPAPSFIFENEEINEQN